MSTQEKFPPPPNLPAGDTLGGKIRFAVRRLLDLNVSSVLSALLPWLAQRTGSLLEVGCGAQPYRQFVPADCRYQGLDWEGSEQAFGYRMADTIYFDGGSFPFPDNFCDSVMHTEVLEHIREPQRFLDECCRVLRPRGELFFSVPFQARYHYIPYDYWRFTPAGLDLMLSKAGFSSWQVHPRGSDITVAVAKCLSVEYRWLQGNGLGKALGLLGLPFLIPLLLIGHVSLRSQLGSADDTLGYNVIAYR